MKVLFIAPYLRTPSGWRTLSVGIMQAMQTVHQVEPHLIVASPDAKAAQQLLPHVPSTILPVVQDFSPRMWRQFPRWLQSWWHVQQSQFEDVTLVHSLEAYPTGLIGHWLAKKLACPHLLTIAGTYGVVWHRNRVDRTLYGRVLSQASYLCPISKGTQRRMRQKFGDKMVDTPSEVVLLGTPPAPENNKSQQKREINTAVPRLLSVAMAKPRKGLHHSIPAFAKVKKHFPNAEYHIIGDLSHASYVNMLKELIQQHQLQDVYLHGKLSAEAVEEAYKTATLFVLTPFEEQDHFEGFGFVYIEAGTYGCPVLGTQHGGVPDAILHGKTGLIVPEGDIEQIANGIIELLSNPKKRQAMGQANRQWSKELSWRRYADQQYKLYQTCLQKS